MSNNSGKYLAVDKNIHVYLAAYTQTNGGNKGEANGGYRLANGGRGGHSETSSLYSRYTSSSERSERRRSRRLGLCIVLTILALIVAILLGLLVYYLFVTSG